MNTAVAVKEFERKASPVDLFAAQVLPPDKATGIWRSLPSHIKPAVFERNLLNALMANPALLNFHPSLVYREVSKAAGLGLLLDPLLGEAYIVVAWNSKAGKKEPQLRIGYKGLCKLARQAGNVSKVYAREVRAADHVECQQGSDEHLVHRPVLFGDRGDVIGYYAVIKWKDGTFDFEPMDVGQCRAIRDRSDAWKAFTEGKIKSTPWQTDEEEMSKKTVLRRLMKRQEQSPELQEAFKIEDEAEFPSFQRGLELVPPTVPDLPDSLPAQAATPDADSVVWEEPAGPQQQTTRANTEASAVEVVAGPAANEGGDHAQVAQGSAPSNPPAVAQPAGPLIPPDMPDMSDIVVSKPAPKEQLPTDPEAFLAWVDTTLAEITDPEKLETTWNDRIAPRLDDLFPPDVEECLGLMRKHERRLAP